MGEINLILKQNLHNDSCNRAGKGGYDESGSSVKFCIQESIFFLEISSGLAELESKWFKWFASAVLVSH